ncbi:CocE/NonD family hydrolase [Stigmatella sp. ncwal1]|uniref:CocE/NonD family hydrolase n=1 Tax=Stigmatella ashevillensis TaxID=2995309 RepID=A0ABT5DET1_9BACT|nr:CocE/NonD family hydrolase [Stigmatella ashevillena]MDC0712185.1 CocE/NonD family hydrolase [Stigmatella ashevillena]
MLKPHCLISLWLVAVPLASAQPLVFSAKAIENEAALAQEMPSLAKKVMAVYRENDRRLYLDNLFRLQLATAQYAEADKTLISLRALRTDPQAGAHILYEVFAQAQQRQEGVTLDEALRQSFHDVLGPLDDRSSARAIRVLGTDPSVLRQALNEALEKQKGKSTLSLADALSLIRIYQAEQMYRSLAPLAESLIAEDDQRRYIIEKDILVKTAEGATLCVLVVRPRSAPKPLPALLNFTIYADPVQILSEARRTASNGYAGVEGLTRGKGCSPDKPVPYEHDGADAAEVIHWISRQPWSDGRVGMYGGSYEGFTQWAAAKRLPEALKALMPAVTAAPGIDVPMEGNVFQTFVYYWPFYTATGSGLDNEAYRDRERWGQMNREWYRRGGPYRELEKIDGTPNPFFGRWLEHPDYDAYWQGMIPYQQEFARINIPVLTTTGYYDGAQIGALYYFIEHHRHRPGAPHYLLIGPYDHVRGQRGTFSRQGDALPVLDGYKTDPVSHIDLGELRYQWFDHVFKGGPKPALLKDKVNYQVMGANQWKHAPSLAAMSNQTLKFHLSAARSGAFHQLSTRPLPGDAFIPLTVDFADRTDVERDSPRTGIVSKNLDTWNGLAFVSDAFQKPFELSGLFSGRLDFTVNRKDLDFKIGLYEVTPQGEYVELSFYMARASYVPDRTHRQLLKPGERLQLDFKSGRMTSRRFQRGSRLAVVLSVIKEPWIQINYGTGKDVSSETLEDAKEPLRIQWHGGTFIEVPVWR